MVGALETEALGGATGFAGIILHHLVVHCADGRPPEQQRAVFPAGRGGVWYFC